MSEATGNPYRIYKVTWIILLIITVAMLASEALHMPRWFLIVFLLAFMMVKAAMIGGNFMHLRYEKRSLAAVVAGGLLITSLILYTFLSREFDYIRRHLAG